MRWFPLAHSGLLDEIARDWEIVESPGYCQNVGSRVFYPKLTLKPQSNHTYSHNSKNQDHGNHKFHKFLRLKSDCMRHRATQWEGIESWNACHPSFNLWWKTTARRFDIITMIQTPLSLAPYVLKFEISWILWYQWHWFFELRECVWSDWCSSFNDWNEKIF